MVNVNAHTTSQAASEIGSAPDPIAIGLLRLQQRLDALDRLYNEDISTLRQELAELKADYVRLYEARSSLPQRGKLPRG